MNLPSHWPEDLKERLSHQRLLTMRDLPPVPPRHCKWCGTPIADGSRRSSWCSEACNNEFLIRWNGQTISRRVEKRDHCICAKCGIDVSFVHAWKRKIQRTTGDIYGRWSTETVQAKQQWGPWHRHTGQLWEADHIVPVVEGGGCCGLDNYRTLCIRCHKEDTAELAARRAQRRREQSGQPVQAALL